jgi:hypothetical protein
MHVCPFAFAPFELHMHASPFAFASSELHMCVYPYVFAFELHGNSLILFYYTSYVHSSKLSLVVMQPNPVVGLASSTIAPLECDSYVLFGGCWQV